MRFHKSAILHTKNEDGADALEGEFGRPLAKLPDWAAPPSATKEAGVIGITPKGSSVQTPATKPKRSF
jgi:hypothetical protein